MGFWSGLGKILTGGASSDGLKAALPGILGAAGSAIGAMGGAASQNRGEQDAFNLRRDQLALSEMQGAERALQDRAMLEIQQQQEQRAAQQAAFANALRSALAMNMQDVSFSRPEGIPHISFSGGARPSAIGAEGRAAAALMNNSALQELMNPKKLTTLPELERMKMSEPSKASFWEKLAGPVGMGLTVAGQVMDRWSPTAAPAQPQGLDPQNFRPALGAGPFSNVRF